MLAGAAYKPELEIVPVAALPPAVPLTLQFTALELAPVTIAVNCAVPPSITVALCGSTTTVTLGGGLSADPPVNPHPAAWSSAKTANTSAASLHVRRSAVSDFCSRTPRLFRKNCSIAVQARPDACDRATPTSSNDWNHGGKNQPGSALRAGIRNSDPPSTPRFLSHNGTAGQNIQFQYGTRDRPNALNSLVGCRYCASILSTLHCSLFFSLIESLWGIKTCRNSLKIKGGRHFWQ